MRFRDSIALCACLLFAACRNDEPLPNTPPFAEDDFVRTSPVDPVVIDVLGNDLDIDGDALSVEISSQPPHAHAVVEGHRIRVTPQPNYIGSTQFEYDALDTAGNRTRGHVTIEFVPMVRVIVGAGTYGVGVPYTAPPFLISPWGAVPLGAEFPGHDLLTTIHSRDERVVLLWFDQRTSGSSIVAIRPRATTMPPPAVILRDARIGGISLSADGSRAVIARITDRSGSFELLTLDTADGTILGRIDGGSRIFGTLDGKVDRQKAFLSFSLPGRRPLTYSVADFASQSISQGSEPVLATYISRTLTDDGEWLLLHRSTDIVALSLSNPTQFQTIWSAATGESLMDLFEVPNSSQVIIRNRLRSQGTLDRFELWLLDPSDPTQRRLLATGVASDRFSLRADGRRLMYLDLALQRIVELSLPDGEAVGQLLPDGDPYWYFPFRYIGNDGKVIVEHFDQASSRRRCFVVPGAARGEKIWLADNLDSSYCYWAGDMQGNYVPMLAFDTTTYTTVGLYIADMRLPALAVPLPLEPRPDDYYVHGVFSIDPP